jgi:hypothetical protein
LLVCNPPKGGCPLRAVHPFGGPAIVIVFGIDPGAKGGLSMVDGASMQLVDSMRMPIVKIRGKSVVDAPRFVSWVDLWRPTHAIIEQASSRPAQGVVSAFSFGRVFGAAEALAQSTVGVVEWVTPSVWKAHYKLSQRKQDSLDLASTMFGAPPDWTVKANEGIAEAALIARWFLDKHANDRLSI